MISLLACMDGFRDELMKIAKAKTAVVGAMAGGALGFAAAPNSIKGKLIGAGLGAATGHGAQALGTKAKQTLIDEPRAREHALKNYVPVAMQRQEASPYGPYVY